MNNKEIADKKKMKNQLCAFEPPPFPVNRMNISKTFIYFKILKYCKSK